MFEPGAVVFCTYQDLLKGECPQKGWRCGKCLRTKGLRGWVRDQLVMALLKRFDLITVTQEEVGLHEMVLAGMESKSFLLRHVIKPEQLNRPLTTETHRRQRAQVEELLS